MNSNSDASAFFETVSTHSWYYFVYRWPMLVVPVAWWLWFVWSSLKCFSRELIHPDGQTLDPAFYTTVLPALSFQSLCIAVFTTWLGWKFFRHN